MKNKLIDILNHHCSRGEAIAGIPAKPTTYNGWIAAVSDEVRNALGGDSSDAFSVVECQTFIVAQCWARDDDAITTANAILKSA